MRIVDEIMNSNAGISFASSPRLVLGSTIFLAGMILLAVQALSVFYR